MMCTQKKFQETANLHALKPFVVLESLSFRRIDSSEDLKYRTVQSIDFNNCKDDTDTKTDYLEKNISSIKNKKAENDGNINIHTEINDNFKSENAFGVTANIERPHFVLESLSFTSTNTVDSREAESIRTRNMALESCNVQNGNVNRLIETARLSQNGYEDKSTDVVPTKNGKKAYYETGIVPKRKPFFVLESLSYNECGVLRIISKRTSEGKSYEIFHPNNTAISNQDSELSTNAKTGSRHGKYQTTRNGPYSNAFLSGRTTSTYGSNLLRVVQYKHALQNSREQNEIINRCLLLETDRVRFEILKTVRQPYIALERLPY